MSTTLSTLHAAGSAFAMADGGVSLDDEVDAVLAGIFTGTPGDDTLTGSAEADSLYGLGGDDLLLPGAGDDLADGGEGTDSVSYSGIAGGGATIDLAAGMVYGGPEIGTDRLVSIENAIGTSDGDVMSGTAGANQLTGGDGADLMYGQAGDDLLLPGAGNDTVDGGDGTDTVSYAGIMAGGMSLDLLAGLTQAGPAIGTDILIGIENANGTPENDHIAGTSGANVLFGDTGNDRLYGVAGDDFLTGGPGNDGLFGAEGNDTASYAGATTGMTVVMDDIEVGYGTVYAGPPIGNDSLTGIENIVGAEAADVIGGGVADNHYYAGGGDDVAFGWAGADELYGGTGNDQLYGQQDDDILDGGEGDDRLHGWYGLDTLTGGAGADIFAVDGIGEGMDLILDYSAAAGDAIDVPEPTGIEQTSYTYRSYQDGTSVDVFAMNSQVNYQILELANYDLADGIVFI